MQQNLDQDRQMTTHMEEHPITSFGNVQCITPPVAIVLQNRFDSLAKENG